MALNFAFTADNKNFMDSVNQIKNGVRDATSTIESCGGDIDRVINMVKGGIAALGIGMGFKELAQQVSSTRGEFQQLEVAFKTMLGSAEEADKLMNQLVRTAAITPFDLQGVANGAKSLMAYGIEAQDVNETLIRLGDIAAGLSIPLNDLVYLYGTTMVQGRMFTQDLRQFQGRGIPIADELAKQFGVAKNKIGELVTAGKVGAKEFQAAIVAMTSEGSQFGGLMEAQSKTITGQISNIEDAIDVMFNEIGKSSEGIINLTLETTSTIVENWQTVLAILGDIAVAYGAQKAFLALDAGFTKAATNYGYDAEIAQLQALLPLKEAEEKTALQQAVASGRLSEAKAEQVLALRAEAEAYLETLAIKEAEARQAVLTSQANLTTALQEKEIADDMVKTAQEKWQAAYDSADAIAEEMASVELETAKTIQSEAADAVATATKEAKAASSAHVTAQQNLESASTGVNTAQTTGNSAATGILTIAKEKLAVAIGKVNAVMNANKFAIVTGAIIALGFAIQKACTYQTDFEKASHKLNDVLKDTSSKLNREESELRQLKTALEKAEKGSKDWQIIKDDIVKKYGQYFPKLDEEITKVGDLSSSYAALTIEIKKAAAARAMDNWEKDNPLDIDNDLKAIQELLEGNDVKFMNPGGTTGEGSLHDATKKLYMSHITDAVLSQDYSKLTKQEQYFLDNNWKFKHNGFYGKITGRSIMYGAGNKTRQYNAGKAKIEDRYGIAEDKKTDTKTETNLKTAFDKAKSDYEKAKSEVDKMNADRASFTQEAYDKATANLKEAKEAYEKLGGVTKDKKSTGLTSDQIASKEETAAGKVADTIRKQAEERLRIEQDYEYQRWQNRIDLMDDGEAKVLEQQRLNNDKELTELKRQQKAEEEAELQRQMALFNAKQDELAAGDKKYAKKVFRDSDIDQSEFDKIKERYENLYADLEASQKKSEQDRLNSAKEAMNAYLKEFGNYQQKREAIEEEYQDKIDKAENAGQRKTLMAQRNQALADLDFNEWQEGGGMALAFGDVSKLSGDTIKNLISEMEKYREKVIKTFDPDKIEKFENALNNLRMADVDMDFTFAGDNDIIESLKERLALQKQIADEEANTTALEEQKAQLKEELNTLNEQLLQGSLNTTAVGPDEKPAVENIGITEDDKKRAEELQVKIDSVSQALAKSATNSKALNSQLRQMGKVKFADIQKFSKNLLNAGKNASQLASIFSDDLAESIDTGVSSLETMFDAFDTLSSNIEALSKAGKDVVKETTNSAKTIVEGASGGMKATAATTATSLSTMEKASAILAIIGAAIQLATMVASLFNSDKKHEKNIERFQDQIDALEKSYDKLSRAADKAYSTDASNLINQQETLLRQQQALIRMQIAEEEAKKKPDKEKIKGWKDALDDIDNTIADNKDKAKEAIIGEDIKSAINDFASAYADAWGEGKNAADASMKAVKNIISSALTELLKKNIQPAATRFYDYLAEAMKRGLTDSDLAILDNYKKQMDAEAARLEEQYKKIQDRYKTLEELQEELTDISFDSVSDNFKSLLSDMESSTKDFTDSFTDMLRNALIQGLMDSKYDQLLKDWYAEFAEAMDDQKLTDEERERLRQQYDNIVQQGLADRDAINAIVGGGAYSQEATSGGWASMGQDTADELNGRFTALTELNAINNNLVSEGNQIAREILVTLQLYSSLSNVTSEENPALLAIKDMMFLATGHLEDIAKYTKLLNNITSGIDNLNDLISKRL